MWIVFALLSAISSTAREIFSKKTLLKERAVEFAFIVSFYMALASAPLIYFTDFSGVDFKFVAGMFIFSVSTGSVAFYLLNKSIKYMEVSVVGALMILNPATVSIFAYFFLDERITYMQIIGIAILLMGAYVLELKEHSKLLDPIKFFIKSKYVHYILTVLVLYSVSSTYDRYILNTHDISVFSYFVLFNLLFFIAMSIIFLLLHRKTEGIRHGLKYYGKPLLLVALFDLIQRLTLLAAINVAYVGLATAVRRMSAIFTVIIGGEIFHEKNILRKTIATGIMVVGAILISI